MLDQINLHFIPIFQNNPDIINSDTNLFMPVSMVLTLTFDLCTLTFDFIFSGLSRLGFVDGGQRFFRTMDLKSCVVSTLGTLGNQGTLSTLKTFLWQKATYFKFSRVAFEYKNIR